jgi:DNA-binding CsgD family transcriptional regulator
MRNVTLSAYKLFRYILVSPEWTSESARSALNLSVEEFQAALEMLRSTGLLRPTNGLRFFPVAPEVAVTRLLSVESESLQERLNSMQELQSTLFALTATQEYGRLGHPQDTHVQLLVGADNVAEALNGAAVEARSAIVSMWPDIPATPSCLDANLKRNREALDRGIVVRAIHVDAMLNVPHGRVYLQELQRTEVEVRLAAVLPFELTLVDNARAYVSTPPCDGQTETLNVHGREICQVLSKAFEYCWMFGSMHPGTSSTSDDLQLTKREMAIVRMMANGMKDDAMARALGVSTRTLRRWMTSVMGKLGADSRFQAGARAMTLGML